VDQPAYLAAELPARHGDLYIRTANRDAHVHRHCGSDLHRNGNRHGDCHRNSNVHPYGNSYSNCHVYPVGWNCPAYCLGGIMKLEV